MAHRAIIDRRVEARPRRGYQFPINKDRGPRTRGPRAEVRGPRSEDSPGLGLGLSWSRPRPGLGLDQSRPRPRPVSSSDLSSDSSGLLASDSSRPPGLDSSYYILFTSYLELVIGETVSRMSRGRGRVEVESRPESRRDRDESETETSPDQVRGRSPSTGSGVYPPRVHPCMYPCTPPVLRVPADGWYSMVTPPRRGD